MKDNPILQILAAIVVFLLGAAMGGMYVKIQYLEGKGGAVAGVTANNTAPTTATAGGAPTPPPNPTKVDIKLTADDPFLGDPNAKVNVVEFADYQCPFCEQFFKNTFSQIKTNYIDTGKVKFYYKNLAFLGQESTDAANAALCAKEQNQFWPFHDYLFNHQGQENSGTFSKDNLKKFAADLGLNTTQFNSCLDSAKYGSVVQADIAEANRNGFNSTPSVAVGSTPIIGAQPYDQFKTAVDAELAKTK